MSTVKILEGNVSRSFTQVTRIETDLQGGGTCLWVCEDEKKRKDLRVSANGSYIAEDEGYFGYGIITVSVPNAASITGRYNGQTYTVTVDATGELVFTPTA